MSRWEKIERIHIILLIVGLVLIGLVVFFIALTLRKQSREQDFSRFIDRTDRLIRSEAYEDALALVKNHKDFRKTAGEWFRLLKRTQQLSIRMKSPEIFSETAQMAVKAYPGNENLRAAAVLALIDAADFVRAGEWAEKHLHSQPYQAIKAEAFLRAGLRIQGTAEGELFLSSLPESRGPEDFLRAADMTGEAGYYLDAALLFLEKGDFKRAVEVLTRPGARAGDKFPFITALALYDAGDFSGSESYLSRVIPDAGTFPLIALLFADLHLRAGRTVQARESYDVLRASYSGISPIPYLNTAIILQPENPEKALSVLKHGLSFFPDNPGIVFSLSKILLARGAREESRTILDTYEHRYGKNGESELLQLFSRREGLHTQRFIGELYLLRGLYPGYEDLDRIIIWHLLSISDYPGIRSILADHGEKDWVRLYRGIVNFSQRDYRDAYENFTHMLLIKESADGRYNQGLSLMALREYGKALESFQEAEKGMNKIVPASARSKITAAIAENYIRLTRYDQAQKKLRNYLTDNPDDARVLRTLRKLEGRPES